MSTRILQSCFTMFYNGLEAIHFNFVLDKCLVRRNDFKITMTRISCGEIRNSFELILK